MAARKGSAFGYPFLFFSVIFYAFLGFLLTQGAGDWMTSTLPNYDSTNTTSFEAWGGTIITNPFSSIGFLTWLSVAIFVVDIYIILSSIT